MRVNGKEEEYKEEEYKAQTLEAFLKEKGFDVQRVAVELNKVIIPRADFAKTKLSKEDILEIVHFVGGG